MLSHFELLIGLICFLTPCAVISYYYGYKRTTNRKLLENINKRAFASFAVIIFFSIVYIGDGAYRIYKLENVISLFPNSKLYTASTFTSSTESKSWVFVVDNDKSRIENFYNKNTSNWKLFKQRESEQTFFIGKKKENILYIGVIDRTGFFHRSMITYKLFNSACISNSNIGYKMRNVFPYEVMFWPKDLLCRDLQEQLKRDIKLLAL